MKNKVVDSGYHFTCAKGLFGQNKVADWKTSHF
jgi:hypothetical protein